MFSSNKVLERVRLWESQGFALRHLVGGYRKCTCIETGISRLEMCFYIQDRLNVGSFTFLYNCIQMI